MTLQRIIWLSSAIGLFILPFIVLIPFGYWWLWTHGGVLLWAAFIALCTIGSAAILHFCVRPRKHSEALISNEEISKPNPDWSPLDVMAWNDIQALISTVDSSTVVGQAEILAVVQKTVEVVARRYRGDKAGAHMMVTIPECLRLISVSAERIRELILRVVPGSRAIRLDHLFWVQSTQETAKSSYKYGHYLWNAYRTVRVALNPLGAAAYEAKGAAIAHLAETLGGYARAQIVRIVIEQVGKTAIDLYSGKLNDPVAPENAPQEPREEQPLRILVAGAPASGKSSLVNALMGSVNTPAHCIPTTSGVTVHSLDIDGQAAAQVIECPGYFTKADCRDKLLKEALSSDLLVWVTRANVAARQLDFDVLGVVRAAFADMPNRTQPPIIIVASHVDKLKPAAEWSPPYNLADPSGSKKAENIRDSVLAIAKDFADPRLAVVPACLLHSSQYNVDAIWAKIAQALPEARRARLLRGIAAAQPGWDFYEILVQIREFGTCIYGRLSS